MPTIKTLKGVESSMRTFGIGHATGCGRPFAIVLAAVVAVAAPASAQNRPPPPPLAVHPLRGGVYWLEGGGLGNTGFVIGDKGVVVIDAQRSTDAAVKVLAEIAKVTPKPVDNVIVTHADPDHIGGLPAFPAGAGVTVQENVKPIVQAVIANPFAAGQDFGARSGPLFKPLAALLPKMKTIGGTETVVLDGVRMVLIHIAPAHTSADLVVYLPAKKIVFGGDVVLTNDRFPIIHTSGSSLGWIETMKAILALDADTYVPGHGPMFTKAMLQAQLNDVEQRREQIKMLAAQNKTLAEVRQALKDPPPAPGFPDFTESTYYELTKGYPTARLPWADFGQ